MKKRSRTRIKRRQRGEVNLNKSMKILARDHYKKINHFFSKKKNGSLAKVNSSLIAVEKFKLNKERTMISVVDDDSVDEREAKNRKEGRKKTFYLGKSMKKNNPMFFSILEQGAANRKQILPSIQQQDSSRFTSMDFFKTMKRVQAKRIRTKRREGRCKNKDLERKNKTFSNFFLGENSLKRSANNATEDNFFWYKIPGHLKMNNEDFNDFYHSEIAEELRKKQVVSYNYKTSLQSESSSMKSFLINVLGSQRSNSKLGSGSFLNIKSVYGKSALGSLKSSMRGKNSIKEDLFSNGSSFVIDERVSESPIIEKERGR